MTKLEEMLLTAKSEIDACSSHTELNDKKAFYLGKKSPLNELMKSMATLSVEEKKTLGMEINNFKKQIEELVQLKRKAIDDELIRLKLESETIDVTMPGKVVQTGTIHPLRKVIEELEDIFLGMGYNVAEGPEVEFDKYNFEMLNVPVGHPFPPHLKQLTSTSTLGSVNGKYDGRKRIFLSAPNIFLTTAFSVPLRSDKVISSSTTKPSICMN